ncbi:hypothetical protein U0033_28195 [Chitinophaga sancti]|uniref:hypothetical protein n=1 Tax=Chitinophaga sancti TaxID=1004 RepID=UPI002E141840|nr:hypothetical protein U0033_28195 [Chitinophaga sancti]
MAQSLSSASRAAIHQSRIDQLGNLGTSRDSFEAVAGALEEAIGAFIERIKDNIDSSSTSTTGAIQNIEMKVEDNSIKVYANDYLLYQDRGVSGVKTKYNTPHSYTDKKPPVQAIIDWITTKNIQLRDEERYHGEPSKFAHLDNEAKIKSAAYAISNHIFNHGFEGKGFYSKEIPQLINDLKSQFANFCVQQISQQIDVRSDATRVIIS